MKSQKNGKRFVSLRLKWAIGTAVGSLIIFFIVAIAMFTSFTQNLFQQERSLLNQGMDNISQPLAKNDQSLTKHSIEQVLDPNNNHSFVRGADYRRPVVKELSDGHLLVNIYNPQGKLLLSTGHLEGKPSLINERQVRIAQG